MTEQARTIPADDLPDLPARPLPARPPGPRPVPDRRAGAARRPVHVVVAAGMTAGLYALSLAGVTALQSGASAQIAADSAPAAGAVAGLERAHDAMEHRLETLASMYATAASRYRTISDGIAGHEQALAALGQQVKAAAGSAGALSMPNVAPLPAVSTSVASGGSRPVVNACTTASGKPC